MTNANVEKKKKKKKTLKTNHTVTKNEVSKYGVRPKIDASRRIATASAFV